MMGMLCMQAWVGHIRRAQKTRKGGESMAASAPGGLWVRLDATRQAMETDLQVQSALPAACARIRSALRKQPCCRIKFLG